MKPAKAALLLLLLFIAVGVAQSKPKKVAAVFQNAHSIYVEAADGDILKPGLNPEDRQAIADVQERLRDWNRYVITTHREQADLVLVVRKGRQAGQQDHAGMGPRAQRSQPPTLAPGQTSAMGPTSRIGQMPGTDGTEVGSASEIGPPTDLLRVYTLGANGKMMGPIWSREMDEGLDGPSVRLVEQLKSEIEKAFPPESAKQPGP